MLNLNLTSVFRSFSRCSIITVSSACIQKSPGFGNVNVDCSLSKWMLFACYIAKINYDEIIWNVPLCFGDYLIESWVQFVTHNVPLMYILLNRYQLIAFTWVCCKYCMTTCCIFDDYLKMCLFVWLLHNISFRLSINTALSMLSCLLFLLCALCC